MTAGCICGILLAVYPAAQPGDMESLRAAKAVALGRQLAAEVERQHRLLTDPETETLLTRLAVPLAAAARLRYPVTIKLVSTGDPLVATLPGGYIYISAGLIAGAAGATCLARILAHQVAHLAMPLHRAGGVGPVPLVFAGGTGGLCSRFTQGDPVPAIYRQIEPEADRMAAGYLRATGLDSTAGGDPGNFERIREKRAAASEPRPAPSLRHPARN